MSVDRLFNDLQSCLFSKHFVSRTYFRYVFSPFRWISMLSSHISLGLSLGLFPFIFNFITTLSVDSSSLIMTLPLNRSLFWLITSTMGITLSVQISISLFVPSDNPFYHCDNLHVCCCNLSCSSLFVKIQHSLPGEWSD